MSLARQSTICFVFVLTLAPFGGTSDAQPPPVEWGKVPASDLSMTSFPEDTNAAGVILADYGETVMNDELDLEFRRSVRIKILNERGYELGTHSVELYTKDHTQRIDDIDGATYTLRTDGAIDRKELDGKAIFEERVDDRHTRYKFTLPGLKPGCVIEFHYKITSNSWYYMSDWTFQRSEPVLWSEYRVRIPMQIQYSGVTVGDDQFFINELTEATQVFSGSALTYLHNNVVKCNQYRWVRKNVPAVRAEPYVTSMNNYLSKVELQLASYITEGGIPVRVLKDWETVVQELLKSEDFGKRMDVSGDVRKLSEQLTAGLTTPQDRMQALYDYVRKTIVWDGTSRFFADHDADEILKNKKGTSAEINFLLMSLLQGAGIQCDPVILSTRSHGIIQSVYPIVTQFNYVVVAANISGQRYYLDATNPHRAFDLLPMRILNMQGLVVKTGPVQWTTITSEKKFSRVTTAELHVADDGKLEGTLDGTDEGYAAVEDRDMLGDETELNVARESFQADETGVTLDSVQVSGRDDVSSPLKLHARFSSDANVQRSGDLLYVTPFVANGLKETPFKTRERSFPVDMAYGRTITSKFNLVLPAGYRLKDSLAAHNIQLPRGMAAYVQRSTIDGNTVHIVGTLEINESEFPPALYPALREFYSQMIAFQHEPVILERSGKSGK